VDDAINPVTVPNLLRAQVEAELLARHASKEATHRVLLPLGGAHDGGNRCSLCSAQQRERTRACFEPDRLWLGEPVLLFA
jgi:hypothetical protein